MQLQSVWYQGGQQLVRFNGECADVEFEEGVAVRKVDRFRSYASAADSFNDYAQLIRNNPRYENVLNAGSDVAGFAAALQNGGYATILTTRASSPPWHRN